MGPLLGIYEHKETKARVLLSNTTAEGMLIINAFERTDFVKVGDVAEDSSEVVSAPKEVEEVPAAKEAAVPPAPVEPKADVYTETKTSKGTIQYRKNGKIISKAEYEKHLGA